jgi:hypothetical protein
VGQTFHGRATLVRSEPNQALNVGEQRFVALHELYAQNVVYWPKKARHWDLSGDAVAVYRAADERIEKSALSRS